MTIIREFIEVESGLKGDGPLVNELIAQSKLLNARILIASQCRMARSVLFLPSCWRAKLLLPMLTVRSPQTSDLYQSGD
jgi:hypothetical protein